MTENTVNEVGTLDEAKSIIESLNNEIDDLKLTILELQSKLESRSSDGRKSQVLDLLRSHGRISILGIANKLGISAKNVSSQLTYLRTDGYEIFTDSKGLKFLYEPQTTEDNSDVE